MTDFEKDTHKVMEEYSKRRRRQLFYSIPIGLVIISIMFSEEGGNAEIFGISSSIYLPVFIAIFITTFGLSLYNWRCPSCNKYLGKTFNPKHCHNCGVVLHD